MRSLVRPRFAVTLTLLRTSVSGQDGYGNDVRESVEVDVPGCAVWPRDSNGSGGNERTGTQDMVIVGYAAILPFGTDVKATDQVRYAGTVYDVDGEPGVWGPSPLTGNVAGVQIALKRVTG